MPKSSARDEHFLQEALKLALRSVREEDGGPFGALVVRDGEVLGRGINRVTASHDPTAHAEIEAIRMACQALGDHQLSGATLYCSCEPCPMCLGAIYWARAERIVYAADRQEAAEAGFDDNLIYEEIGRAPDQRRIPSLRLALDERLEAFRLWADKEDKIEY